MDARLSKVKHAKVKSLSDAIIGMNSPSSNNINKPFFFFFSHTGKQQSQGKSHYEALNSTLPRSPPMVQKLL